MTMTRRGLIGAAGALMLPARLTMARSEGPLIAAAASVREALDEIAAAYGKTAGAAPRITYGATGNFARQIEQGAPFELLLAADEATIARLHGLGRAENAGAVYASGRLAFYANRQSAITLDQTLADLRAAVGDGRIRRFAIANPDLAPYGVAAREVLNRLGLLDALKDRLVLGENVGQAVQFVASGAAQAGLVAASLLLSPGIAANGIAWTLPGDWHAPLRQRMALMRGAGSEARAFHDYLLSDPARAMFRKFGFEA